MSQHPLVQQLCKFTKPVFPYEVVQRVASAAYIQQLIWWIEMLSIRMGFSKTRESYEHRAL